MHQDSTCGLQEARVGSAEVGPGSPGEAKFQESGTGMAGTAKKKKKKRKKKHLPRSCPAREKTHVVLFVFLQCVEIDLPAHHEVEAPSKSQFVKPPNLIVAQDLALASLAL